MEQYYLSELRHRFEATRRPFGFNYVHYLLLYLYNSSTSTATLIKTYPVYPLFIRVQRKLRLDDRINEHEPDENRHRAVINTLVTILNEDRRCLSEMVEQTHLNVYHYPIGCLFRQYSPMHLLLFMEPMFLFKIDSLYPIIKQSFMHEYPKEKCDYVHYCIAHRKTKLMMDLLFNPDAPQTDEDEHWLISKINTPSDRSWLPIHYVSNGFFVKRNPQLDIHFRLPMSVIMN